MYYLVYVYGEEEDFSASRWGFPALPGTFVCEHQKISTSDDRWLIYILSFLQLRKIITYVGIDESHLGSPNLNPWG